MKYKTAKNSFVYDLIQQTGCAANTTLNLLGETYSQCYEDIILTSLIQTDLLQQIQPVSVIEIGANHPIANSNSLLFEKLFRARAVLFEAIPSLAQQIQQYRPQAEVIAAAVVPDNSSTVSFHIGNKTEVSGCDRDYVQQWHKHFDSEISEPQIITVPAININTVLKKYLKPGISVLSIDCEGLDLDLVAAIDFNEYKPTYICVEHQHINKNIVPQLKTVLTKYTLCAITDINSIFKVTK